MRPTTKNTRRMARNHCLNVASNNVRTLRGAHILSSFTTLCDADFETTPKYRGQAWLSDPLTQVFRLSARHISTIPKTPVCKTPVKGILVQYDDH